MSHDRTRTLQAMMFGTTAGESLRELLMEIGHINQIVSNDAEAVAQNVVTKVFEACGVQLVPQPKVFVSPMDSVNVIDQVLQGESNA